MENMRNIIRIKDVPSNTIEEAIIILKENKKAKKHEYSNKFKNINITPVNKKENLLELKRVLMDIKITMQNKWKKDESNV